MITIDDIQTKELKEGRAIFLRGYFPLKKRVFKTPTGERLQVEADYTYSCNGFDNYKTRFVLC